MVVSPFRQDASWIIMVFFQMSVVEVTFVVAKLILHQFYWSILNIEDFQINKLKLNIEMKLAEN